MGNILAATAPIYLLIIVGYSAVRLGWMAQGELRALGRFAGQFCLPVLVFGAVVRQGPASLLHPDYLWVYGLGSLLSMAIVAVLALRWRRQPLSMAIFQGLGASGSNSAFVGYPIVFQVLGPIAATGLALNMLVENLLVLPLVLALADFDGHRKSPLEIARATAFSLVRNPVLIAVLAGLLWSASGLMLPVFLDKAVGMLSAAASPVALFFIGGTLVGMQFQGMRAGIGLVAVGKLILHPLCVALFVLLIGIELPELRTVAILSAAMPMLSLYPVLALRYGHERFCAAALLVTTMVSFFTISALIALLGAPASIYR